MFETPRCVTPKRPGSGRRCDSALSARSTAPPTRPGSSLAASRGPSRASGAASPGGDPWWREDARWPVREGGITSLPGENISLDIDLDLARWKLNEDQPANSLQSRKTKSHNASALTSMSSKAPQQMEGSTKRRGGLFENPSSPKPSSPLIRGDPLSPAARAEVMRWSFRTTKEDIKERLELLDQSFYDADFRSAVYLRREEDPDMGTPLEKIFQLFVSSGIKNWGQATHPDNLDFWLTQEGGCARTAELLLALEVLNFYRWICRLDRVKVDSFLQELADIFLQAIQKRSERPLCKATEDHEALAEAIEEFKECEGVRYAFISHVPSAADAAKQIFVGLPAIPTSDKGALALHGQSEVILPLKGQASLEPWLPLFRMADEDARRDEGSRKASTLTRASLVTALPGIRREHVPDGPPPALPPPPGGPPPPGAGFGFVTENWFSPSGSSLRKCRCWGDIKGVVTLRRNILDPRVFSIGLLRRGCNFLVLMPAPEFFGQPPEEIHEDEEDPEDDFLEPDVAGSTDGPVQKVKTKINKELQLLWKWREAEGWKKMVKVKTNRTAAGPQRLEEKLVSLDETVDLEDMEGWSVLRGTFMQELEDPIPFARRTQDDHDAQSRTEHALRREGKYVETKTANKRFQSFMKEPELMQPLMVTFPPPGFVPIEMLAEADMMPWTICPDPMRMSPTLDCRVQVFRVRLDHAKRKADREAEVPLSNFCIDCSDIGTGFCVIFTPDVRVRADDEFEVLLHGLVDKQTPHGVPCCLQYFITFASFGRHHQDHTTLVRRSAHWLRTLQTPAIWEEVQFHSGDDRMNQSQGAGQGPDPVAAVKKVPGITGRKGGLKVSTKNKDGLEEATKPKSKMLQIRFEEPKAAPTSFDIKRPPPIGVVKHPTGVRTRQGYHIEVKGTNEVIIALLHPSTVVVKAQLSCFLKSQAKWESISHAVWQMSFDEPSTDAIRDTTEGPEARHKRQTRVLLQVMVPTFGQYELRFQWGLVPLTTADAGLCRMVRCGVTQFEHPLRITLQAARQEGLFKHLVPSLLHTSVQKYGYPVKHPLAEQFGMVLLQPLRHRLKRGSEVRFLVYSMQGSEKEDLVKSVRDSKPTPTRGHDRRRESHMQEVLAEDGSGPKQTSESLRHRIRKILKPSMRCGSSAGLVRIVAVMGNWQRVQLLSRRVLSGDSMAGDQCASAEVHEALVRLTMEDSAQTIQLVVFQVGSDMALDELLAWRVENGRDKEPLMRKDSPPEKAPVLGSTPRPNYWVLAEFQVDNLSTPLPYDEDEMLKPPPPPPDAIELIRNLEVGRAVKLDHDAGEEAAA